jgi:hypothetical protein
VRNGHEVTITDRGKPNVGVKQVSEKVWLVSFMKHDLGFFDDETGGH